LDKIPLIKPPFHPHPFLPSETVSFTLHCNYKLQRSISPLTVLLTQQQQVESQSKAGGWCFNLESQFSISNRKAMQSKQQSFLIIPLNSQVARVQIKPVLSLSFHPLEPFEKVAHLSLQPNLTFNSNLLSWRCCFRIHPSSRDFSTFTAGTVILSLARFCRDSSLPMLSFFPPALLIQFMVRLQLLSV
jgi:hypothetical protein